MTNKKAIESIILGLGVISIFFSVLLFKYADARLQLDVKNTKIEKLEKELNKCKQTLVINK
jgi:hypothetical protein